VCVCACERERVFVLLLVCLYYGVATVSRIDQIIGLFCRISSIL